MKRMMKIGFVALAVTMTTPAFSEIFDQGEGPIGWTPVALGLATPVQIPWGLNRWDVYGLDVNLFYTDTARMRGLCLGGLAVLNRDELMGLQGAGLANISFEDVYGLRLTLGCNFCKKNVYGMDAGLCAYRDEMHGFDVNLAGAINNRIGGCQIGGVANIAFEESHGVTIAGISNIAKTARGLQLAIGLNVTEELHGCQIAFVNYAETCPSGFQIGLINIIMDNEIKVLPVINGFF